MKDTNDNQWKDSREFVENGGIQFLEALEVKQDCAGICKTPLFYMVRPLSDGRPTNDCLNSILDDIMATSNSVGIVSMITAFALLIGMGFACPLCTGFSEEDDK
jgi:hypothetical protein